jgi:hypothetical protein
MVYQTNIFECDKVEQYIAMPTTDNTANFIFGVPLGYDPRFQLAVRPDCDIIVPKTFSEQQKRNSPGQQKNIPDEI